MVFRLQDKYAIGITATETSDAVSIDIVNELRAGLKNNWMFSPFCIPFKSQYIKTEIGIKTETTKIITQNTRHGNCILPRLIKGNCLAVPDEVL